MNITEKAQAKLISLTPADKPILFVQRIGGGCSGIQHKMGFISTSPEDCAETAISNSVGTLVVRYHDRDKNWFSTATLNYEDGLTGKGFVWNNSAAKGCCGCGKSMSC